MQFFPQIEPFTASRKRAFDGLEHLGATISRIAANVTWDHDPDELFISNFNYRAFNNVSGHRFESWKEMYGPVEDSLANDLFENLHRYPLDDQEFTYMFGGLNVTGYGPRKNFSQPYESQNIVMLMDGWCASTCAVFAEAMKEQSNVKTVVIGGRPKYGKFDFFPSYKLQLILSSSRPHARRRCYQRRQ